ncbi:MAG TPA: hypothetical protein VKU94_00385 [Geobacterales bacterium]|nr:hypothetical protein [Geobacterales bacterium]
MVERFEELPPKIRRVLNYLFNNIAPYLLAIVTIAYLAGIIFVITQNTIPYIQTGPNSPPIIIYPNSASQQTILETTLVFIILLFIFVSLLGIYTVGSRKYHAKPPTTLLALSIFLFFVLFFVMWVMLLQKVP